MAKFTFLNKNTHEIFSLETCILIAQLSGATGMRPVREKVTGGEGICKAALPLEVVPGARCVSFLFLSYYCWAFY